MHAGRSGELRDLSLAYVHHVDLVTGMNTAHMSAHIRRMPRPVYAVRAIEPGRLAALDPQVIQQIMLHAKHAAAIAAGILRDHALASERRREGGGGCVRALPAKVLLLPHRRQLGTCKKKAQDVLVIGETRDDRGRVASPLNL